MLRGGADVALVALAAVAYWQLRVYSAQGSAGTNGSGGGSTGVNPVLVAAPALALCAGTLLALRLLPPVARLAERLAARGRGLPRRWSAGSSRAVPSRAPARCCCWRWPPPWAPWRWARAAAGSSRRRTRPPSTPVARCGSPRTAPLLGQGGAFGSLPGVTAAVPVGRESLSLSASRTGELIALDTRTEAGQQDWRKDLSAQLAGRLLASLADPPQPAAQLGIQLPGSPATLVVDTSATLTRPGGGTVAPASMSGTSDELMVTVTDRYGISSTLPPVEVPIDGAVHTLSFDLRAAAGSGTPAYPLTVSGLQLSTRSPGTGRWTSGSPSPRCGDRDGRRPGRVDWTASFDNGSGSYQPQTGSPVGSVYAPGSVISAVAQPGKPLVLDLNSGQVNTAGADSVLAQGPPPPVMVTVTPAQGAVLGPLPGIADQRFLTSSGARVGSIVPVPTGSGAVDVRIVASVTAIPGTGSAAEQGIDGSTLVQGSGYGSSDPSEYGGALLVDLGSYNRRAAVEQSPALAPSEWWLSVGSAPGTAARVLAELGARSDVEAAFGRAQTAATLKADPLGTGPEAALLAAVALAVVLAAVGFSADAAGAVRRRAGETAVLRALGAPTGTVARSTAVQLGLPALIGTGIGLLLGELVTRLVVPGAVVLTRRPGSRCPRCWCGYPAGSCVCCSPPSSRSRCWSPQSPGCAAGTRHGSCGNRRSHEAVPRPPGRTTRVRPLGAHPAAQFPGRGTGADPAGAGVRLPGRRAAAGARPLPGFRAAAVDDLQRPGRQFAAGHLAVRLRPGESGRPGSGRRRRPGRRRQAGRGGGPPAAAAGQPRRQLRPAHLRHQGHADRPGAGRPRRPAAGADPGLAARRRRALPAGLRPAAARHRQRGRRDARTGDRVQRRHGPEAGRARRLGPALHPRRGRSGAAGGGRPVRPHRPRAALLGRRTRPGPARAGPDPGGNPKHYWHAEALISDDAKPALAGFGGMNAYWWLPLDPGSLHAYQVGADQAELADLQSGPLASQLLGLSAVPNGVVINTSVPTLLTAFTSQSGAVLPLLSIGAAGAAGVALTVLLMAGGLAADRRDGELALLRARGGSLPALARRFFGETLVCTTLGAVPGAVLALWLLPGPRSAYALLAAAAVWLTATVTIALRALARCRRAPGARERADLTSARPSRRRTVAEAGVLVAAAAAAVLVRRQGVTTGGGVNLLLSCAPLLLALSGALVLLRIYPWPLRALARRRARDRGPSASSAWPAPDAPPRPWRYCHCWRCCWR
ncbi:ABC transporter permease [Streptacidiphilus sp. 4-A2]|nr:ABC transporter permease [Streptacidiphilus sp. 4-A2]